MQSSELSHNNKRIAKNTLFLYFRMILVMGVTLYTSRIILKSLGVEGYGLYNVIGGVVGLFAVVSGALSSAISRFLTYELGTGNQERLKKIFSCSVCIQLILSATIIIIFAPIGIWFISHKMEITGSDYDTAYWVFGFSIATFCLNLLSVPYNAAIISHENMSVFSYVSILEVSLKLGVAYLITVFPDNRVIIYAALLFGVSLVIQFIYMNYCRIKFPECVFSIRLDAKILKEIGGFAGWNTIGSASAILRNQGNNVILNIFYGTVVNAAYGIAMQVNNAVSQLADNFMVSVNPQITKYYAANERENMNLLIFRSAKLSFYLTWLISMVIIVETPYILHLWLSVVPDDTIIFVRLIMLLTLSESISKPLITAMLATGRIRNYQIVVGGFQMLNLPMSYIILKLGGAAYWPLAVAVIISQLCLASRLIMLKKMIDLQVGKYLKSVYLNALSVAFISLVLPFILQSFIRDEVTVIKFICVTFSYLIWTCVVIIAIGLNRGERKFISNRLRALTLKLSKI